MKVYGGTFSDKTDLMRFCHEQYERAALPEKAEEQAQALYDYIRNQPWFRWNKDVSKELDEVWRKNKESWPEFK